MRGAWLRKIGWLTIAVGCLTLGIALWVLPTGAEGGYFDRGDRVSGTGLIAAGVLAVVLALVGRTRPGARADGA